MYRIIWAAWIVVLLAVSGCAREPHSATDASPKDSGTASAEDATGDTEAAPVQDSGPADQDANESTPDAAINDADPVTPAKDQSVETASSRSDAKPAVPQPKISPETSNWLTGMLGDASERLEAIERLDAMGDDAIAAATHVMRTGDVEARRGATAYLGIRVSPRDEEAIGELCTALNDADSQVRHEALQAVDRLPKSQLVYALAGLIAMAERSDEDASFRVLALRKLGSLGPDGRMAAEALVRLGREDSSSNVRIAAFSTMSKVAEPELAEKFYVERLANSQEMNERRLAAKWLGRVASTAAGLDGLVKAFADSEKDVRMAATESLVDIGKPAVPALAQGLEASESQVRQYCAFTLGKLGRLGRGATEALRKATEDEDPQVRKVAEAALRLVENG